jgi:hypothetical protein
MLALGAIWLTHSHIKSILLKIWKWEEMTMIIQLNFYLPFFSDSQRTKWKVLQDGYSYVGIGLSLEKA